MSTILLAPLRNSDTVGGADWSFAFAVRVNRLVLKIALIEPILFLGEEFCDGVLGADILTSKPAVIDYRCGKLFLKGA